MTLKGKVFLALLWPLFFTAALLYVLALFALKKEVTVAEKNLSTQIHSREAIERKEIATLFDDELSSLQKPLTEWINSLSKRKELFLGKKPSEILLSLHFLTKADVIELGDNEFLYRYFPSLALFHPFDKVVALKAGYLGEIGGKVYFAMPVKEGALFLFEWECLTKEQKQKLEAIALPNEKKNTLDKEELLSLLLPVVIDGYSVNDEKVFPAGIATIENERGSALLVDDFFMLTTERVKENEKPYLFEKNALFSMERTRIAKREIGLGFSLSEILKRFSHSLNTPLFVTTDDERTIGFLPNGMPIDAKEKSGLSLFSEPINASITLHFLYNKLDYEKPLLSSMVLYSRLFRLLAIGLFVVAVLFFLTALYLFWYFLRGIMHPLDLLADAQQKVAEGKFEEVAITTVAMRKDEIGRLATTFLDIVESIKEREKIRSILNKVVSKEIADEILKEPVHLGGEDRVVTMLFADIRNFTHITAHFPPQKVVSLLNRFMTKMTRIIEGEGGIIDKYVGDEIMALFGAPIAHPDHAIRALAASKLMIETLKRWNVEREKEGEAPLEIGIGIHTGLVVAGNMGTEDRLNYTVIGADVALAARLCQAAVPGQVLLSEHTLCEPNVKESFEVKELPPIHVKGFDEEIKVYEVIGFKWEVGQ